MDGNGLEHSFPKQAGRAQKGHYTPGALTRPRFAETNVLSPACRRSIQESVPERLAGGQPAVPAQLGSPQLPALA
jgi:hypothetical protein